MRDLWGLENVQSPDHLIPWVGKEDMFFHDQNCLTPDINV